MRGLWRELVELRRIDARQPIRPAPTLAPSLGELRPLRALLRLKVTVGCHGPHVDQAIAGGDPQEQEVGVGAGRDPVEGRLEILRIVGVGRCTAREASAVQPEAQRLATVLDANSLRTA